MSQTYSQLTLDQRSEIQSFSQSGYSIRSIARKLNRDASTISREIERNQNDGEYRCVAAQEKADERRHADKKPFKINGELERLIRQCIQDKFSPEQTAGFLSLNHGLQISHTYIYQYIYDDRSRGGELYKNLRRAGKKYKKRKGKEAGKSLIPNRTCISERPVLVDLKQHPGHWEGDTVIGVHHQGALVTLVERVSKYTLIGRVRQKTAELVGDTIQRLMIDLVDWVWSTTFDNGMEFANHETFAEALQMDVYFAHPYHSWERGLNENTNGLIRQYFPKGTNFRLVSDGQVQRVQDALNNRPRKALGYRTPRQMLIEYGAIRA